MIPLASWRITPILLAGAFAASARSTTPAEQGAAYAAQSGAPASAARGERFFTTRHGHDWACASCHSESPSQPGRHATTGRPIAALAPAFNPERFTDAAKTEKWFRRNCKDVAGRECTPGEKADVLAWLISVKK